MLKLRRPIVFIDLETTGLDRESDRIVQIAMYKLMPDFSNAGVFASLVNPGCLIPEGSTAVHKITNEMVKDEPLFAELAGDIYQFIFGCDIGGFNSNYFDVPILHREFNLAGFAYALADDINLIDVGNLFKIREPRNLANAVRFYCGREMVNAHDAAVDIAETVNVFLSQLQGYDDLPETVEELALYTNYGMKMADLSGKFVYSAEGALVFNFGKYKGKPVVEHMDFVSWMYFKADFPPDTRRICEALLNIPAPAVSDDDDLPF